MSFKYGNFFLPKGNFNCIQITLSSSSKVCSAKGSRPSFIVRPITDFESTFITIGFLKMVRVKVKCTLIQALRLCTGRTAYRGDRGIALLFLDHGTKRGREVTVTPRPLFTPGKDTVPIVQEGRWAPGPVWTDAENLAPTGIRSPDHPARSQSLYRLRYPAHISSSSSK